MHHSDRLHRSRNLNISGHAHALTFTCYHRYEFLSAERTCTWLAEAINEARTKLNFAVWAFVFMPEHVHLVLWPRNAIYDMAEIRQAIKEPVGREGIKFLAANSPEWIQKVTRRRGSRTERLFWQSGGGFDENIDNPKTLWQVIEYIHLNPVRRKLVTRAQDWKWSSAAALEIGGTCPLPLDPIPTDWLL